MEHQLCTTIQIGSPVKKQPTSLTILKRRQKKLSQLRINGYFTEEAIKIRHPMLYHNYLNRSSHEVNRSDVSNGFTLSDFLSKNLMSVEHRERVELELSGTIEYEVESQSQEREEMEGEKELVLTEVDFEEKWEPVEEEQIELEELSLVEQAEQLFLNGKVDPSHINYQLIDFNSEYDDREYSDKNQDCVREEGTGKNEMKPSLKRNIGNY